MLPRLYPADSLFLHFLRPHRRFLIAVARRILLLRAIGDVC